MHSILNFENRYRARRLLETEKAHVSATLLGVTVFPGFALLDWFTQRSQFTNLSIVRFSTTFVFLIAHLLARRGICPGGVGVTATVLLLVSAASITWMCLLTGGAASPYYAGISLLLLTCVTYPPGDLKKVVIVCFSIVAVYIAGIVGFEPRLGSELPHLINNIVFLGATLVIGVTTAVFNERLRRDAFLRLLEAEDAEAVRRALGIRDEFISIASHELCTPVTSMKLQNDLIKSEIASSTPQEFVSNPKRFDRLRQWVSRNDQQLARLTRLIEDMLDISRINTGRMQFSPRRLDLGEIVQDAIDRFSAQFRNAGIQVRTAITPGVRGSWDPLRVEQVFLNIFSNVVKYAAGKSLDVRVDAHSEMGVVRVIDHGPGIALENRERIFERFERAHSATGVTGLGLGLYIARKIVEGHGGTIRIEDSQGGGSTFVITLPLFQVGIPVVSSDAAIAQRNHAIANNPLPNGHSVADTQV